MRTEIRRVLEDLVEHMAACDFFLVDAVKTLEKAMIARAMKTAGGNRTEASKILGIHRNTLQSKLEEYAVAVPRKPPQKAGPALRARAK